MATKHTVNTVKVWDWDDNSPHKITTYRQDDHFRIEVDGAFWSTAEMPSEVLSEVQDIIKLYNWRLIPAF